jgi:hypothetical protein
VISVGVSVGEVHPTPGSDFLLHRRVRNGIAPDFNATQRFLQRVIEFRASLLIEREALKTK